MPPRKPQLSPEREGGGLAKEGSVEGTGATSVRLSWSPAGRAAGQSGNGRPVWTANGTRSTVDAARGGGVAACPARRPRQFSHFESGSRAGVGWAARHASWARRGHACHGAGICSRVGCDPPTSQRSAGDQWPLRSCGLG